jgi:Pyruvate/2-oxoacid:ferredoxin oxidoreductase delta subunit
VGVSITMNVPGVEIEDKKSIFIQTTSSWTLAREHIHYNVIHTCQKCIQIHTPGQFNAPIRGAHFILYHY